MKKEIYITDYQCVTPLGFDSASTWKQVLKNKSGVAEHNYLGQSFFVSKVNDEELYKLFSIKIKNYEATRLEKMLILCLHSLVKAHAVSEKSALVLSTTKGNISALKDSNNIPEDVYLPHLAQKIADFFGFKTKPVVVSNACVSGVMAISVAKNMIAAGICEDAFVLAGDEVSEFVLSGFQSFQAISNGICRPYDQNRSGINLGEAAAACFITANPLAEDKITYKILGEAAVNDANHISGPSRTGEGLFSSISKALQEAKISAQDIDFISAHGTATPYNDEMESVAFQRAQLSQIPLHSLKGYFGHTLGASGLLESIIAMESMRENILIASKNYQVHGVSQPMNIVRENTPAQLKTILKTASGFGGCNAALILQKIG